MSVFKSVTISNCEGGIRASAKINGTDVRIENCGTGLELSGEGVSSTFEGLTIDNCVQAISVSIGEQLPPSAEDSLREVLAKLNKESSKDEIELALQTSGFGRWCRENAIGLSNLGFQVARWLQGLS